MIPSTQWWIFLPHVHLKMLEEIDVLQGILMEFILLVFQLEETLAKMINHARKLQTTMKMEIRRFEVKKT